MGYGLVNIWVKNERCQVIKRAGHLHIYDCTGAQVIPTLWFTDGHAEVLIPPGCYIVTAGIVSGNIYTDKTCFMVRCGEEACVCLIMNEFKEQQLLANDDGLLQQANINPVNVNGGCTSRIIAPYVYNARIMGIPIPDIEMVINGLLPVAETDMVRIKEGLTTEINILRNNLDYLEPIERGEVENYIMLIEEFIMHSPV